MPVPRIDLAPQATIRHRGAPLVALLKRGGVLAIPTESSYGLAVDPWNPSGVEAVYRLKGRPRNKALLVVAAEVSQLEALGIELDAPPLRQLLALWPAPLTAVLPIRRPLPASGEEQTLAVRIPAHEPLRAWLRFLGPLTATSANRSDEPPIHDPESLQELLQGQDAAILDGGRLHQGAPSTLVRWRGEEFEVLRQGAFAVEPLRVMAPTLLDHRTQTP